MQIYKVKPYANVTYDYGRARLRCIPTEEHPQCTQIGDVVITSALQFIDFDRKIAVTANNIYTWEEE